MISKAITAPFRWWAKHPWMVFWAIPLLVLFIIIIDENTDLPAFVVLNCAAVLVIAWILSWCRGVFVTWQRSKVLAVQVVATFAITSVIIIWTIPMFGVHYRSCPLCHYDSTVKGNIKNAASAQEAHFVDYDTYTSNVGSLVGFNQNANVNITMEATTTTFVITGTATERCKPDTGIWSFNSTTGKIDGTPCR